MLFGNAPCPTRPPLADPDRRRRELSKSPHSAAPDDVQTQPNLRNAPLSAQGRATAAVLLTSPAFLLALGLLVLNDWGLKPFFGNWLTGKLSDFSGLFAFALFWTALLPRRRTPVFVLTAVGILIWKSPLSEAPLAWWNALGVWPLTRVVDYTDWIALAALIPAHRLAHSSTRAESCRTLRLWRQAGAVTAAGFAIVVFSATSMAPPSYPIPDHTGSVVAASRGDIRTGLDSLGLYVIDYHSVRTEARRRAFADTLLVYIRQPPERTIGLKIEVRSETPDESRITLLSASTDGPPPTTSIHRAFGEQVLQPLHIWAARSRPPGWPPR